MDNLSKEAAEKLWEAIKSIPEPNYKLVYAVTVYTVFDLIALQMSLESLNGFLDQIIIIDVHGHFYANIDLFQKYKNLLLISLTQEDINNGVQPFNAIGPALQDLIVDGYILEDDLICLGTANEVPSLMGLLIAKSYYPNYSQPITLNQNYSAWFFNTMLDYRIAGPIMAPIYEALKDSGGLTLRENRQRYAAIEGGGYRYEFTDKFLGKSKIVKIEDLPVYIQENLERYREFIYTK